jgi:hypothetical protein
MLLRSGYFSSTLPEDVNERSLQAAPALQDRVLVNFGVSANSKAISQLRCTKILKWALEMMGALNFYSAWIPPGL